MRNTTEFLQGNHNNLTQDKDQEVKTLSKTREATVDRNLKIEVQRAEEEIYMKASQRQEKVLSMISKQMATTMISQTKKKMS